MAPMDNARSRVTGRSQPTMRPVKPADFTASPNDPPIRPVPMIVIWLKGICSRFAVSQLGQFPPNGWSDQPEFAHQFLKLFGIQRLRAVRQRLVRRVVYFHQEAIGAGCDGGASHGRNFVATACAV